MRLLSDFRDFYDAWFDRDGPVFSRLSRDNLDKRAQFSLMEQAGYKCPPHGKVVDIVGMSWEEGPVKWVVVYDDLLAHCGEGKRLVHRSSLNSTSPEMTLYCSAYLGQPLGSVSWRHLQIGPHVFWIEYRSEGWRSNVDGDCEVIGVELNKGFHPAIKLPLFAIDFVIGKEMYAIDFNSAPGMRGTVERFITGREVVDAIKSGHPDVLADYPVLLDPPSP